MVLQAVGFKTYVCTRAIVANGKSRRLVSSQGHLFSM